MGERDPLEDTLEIRKEYGPLLYYVSIVSHKTKRSRVIARFDDGRDAGRFVREWIFWHRESVDEIIGPEIRQRKHWWSRK